MGWGAINKESGVHPYHIDWFHMHALSGKAVRCLFLYYLKIDDIWRSRLNMEKWHWWRGIMGIWRVAMLTLQTRTSKRRWRTVKKETSKVEKTPIQGNFREIFQCIFCLIYVETVNAFSDEGTLDAEKRVKVELKITAISNL